MKQPPPGADRPTGVAELLTIAQAAALLGVSKMTVYRFVHAGALPALRIGRSFRIRRADLTPAARQAPPMSAPSTSPCTAGAR